MDPDRPDPEPSAPTLLPPEAEPRAEAPWRDAWFDALERNAHDRLVHLATVSPAGDPEVRTVVLRSVARDGRPVLFGDARAAKHRAILAGSTAELCTWWAASQEQFRLRGPLEVADAGAWRARRLQLWREQGDEGRALFLGGRPGAPLEDAAASTGHAHDPDAPPPWFAVYVLVPRRVDRLRLGPPHRREIYRLEAGGWRGGPVVP